MSPAREAVEPERLTFHSRRMRTQKVTKEETSGHGQGRSALRKLRKRLKGASAGFARGAGRDPEDQRDECILPPVF